MHDRFDTTFAALADPTRRAILARLAAGRGHRQRAGGAVQPHPAVDLQAPQGAGARGPYLARARGADAAVPAGDRPAPADRGMGRGLPPPLGGQLRAARCSPQIDATSESERTQACRQISARRRRHRRRLRHCPHLRGPACPGLEGVERGGRVQGLVGAEGMLPVEVATIEFRPGGFFHYSMRFANGTEWWGQRFLYREIVR